MKDLLDIADTIKSVDKDLESLQESFKIIKDRMSKTKERSTLEIRNLQEEVNFLLAESSVTLFNIKSINWKLYVNKSVSMEGPLSVKRTVTNLIVEIKEMSQTLVVLINAFSEISRNLRSMSAY